MATTIAYGHGHQPSQVGVQSGTLVAQGSISSGATRNDTITFPKPFRMPPVAVVGFESSSTSGTFGRCVCAVYEVTETTLTIRTFNGDSSGRNPAYHWIAVGELA